MVLKVFLGAKMQNENTTWSVAKGIILAVGIIFVLSITAPLVCTACCCGAAKTNQR
jgi:hypothetical protein